MSDAQWSDRGQGCKTPRPVDRWHVQGRWMLMPRDCAMMPAAEAPPRATLNRHTMLCRPGDFALLREKGGREVGRRMVLSAIPSPDGQTRVAFIVSRKYHKRAVIRNRARRLMRESFRLLQAQIAPPLWFVLIARSQLQGCGQAEVQRELVWLLRRAGHLAEGSPS